MDFVKLRNSIQNLSYDDIIDSMNIDNFCRINLGANLSSAQGKIYLNDYRHPFILANFKGVFEHALCIDLKYYHENLEEVNLLLNIICEQKQIPAIEIMDRELITPELLAAIIKNEHIKIVNLGNGEEPYILTKDVYELFKNTHVREVNTALVEEELLPVMDELIGYNMRRKLIGMYNYNYLQKTNELIISEPIPTAEIENFKYVQQNATIKITHNNYENIFAIIDHVKYHNLNFKIILYIKDKEIFNQYVFNYLEYFEKIKNINVHIDNQEISLSNYLSYEKRLWEWVLPARNLSPFEKHLFIYNIAKNYKEYRENPDDVLEARDLYNIIDNEYMVCVGFSNLLIDLGRKLGLAYHSYDVAVETGFDELKPPMEVIPSNIKSNIEYHSRVICHLVDPKYSLDGYYISDPTWDNDLENDYYNYCLLTPKETEGMERYNYVSKLLIKEVFFAATIEEFYQKVNYWLDHNKKGGKDDDVIFAIAEEIKYIDYPFYEKLASSYPTITYCSQYSSSVRQEIITILGNHIVKKVNCEVTLEHYKKCLDVVLKCYGYEDEREEMIQNIIEQNRIRQSKSFPTLEKINKDGTRMIILNEKNKFFCR